MYWDQGADMNRKVAAFMVVVLLAAGLSLAAGGCKKKEETGGEPESGRTSVEQNSSTNSKAVETVTMNGRSVMEGWMKHWGFTWEGPVEKNGYLLDYRELDANDIAPSFAKNTEGLAPGSVTFFKFCFADFDGSNLSQREREVEEVIKTARDLGLKLIIGNALPVRKSDGNPEMLNEYKKFNDFLQQKAQESQDVWVYDFYGILAGGDGWLKPDYQTDDSHPNDEAYTALDPSFFELLGAVHEGQTQ
jgi:hypothetical protein